MYVCSSMRINSPSLQSLCQMWALDAIILRRGVKRLIVLWALRCKASEQIGICVKWSVSRWGKTVTYAVVFCVFCLLYFMPPQSYYTFWNLSILYSPVRLHNAFPDIGYTPAHRSHLSKTTTPREFSWGFWGWSAQENPQWLMGRREFLQTHFASSLTAALK